MKNQVIALALLLTTACGSAEGQAISGAIPAWHDASGALVSHILGIKQIDQGLEHYILHQDGAGALWYVNARSGEIAVPTVATFWTSSNCTGTAYVDLDFPGTGGIGTRDYQLTLFPRVAFRIPGEIAVRVIPDDATSSTISPMSRDTGSGCVAMAGGNSGLPTAEVIPIAGTTPPSPVTEPSDFTGPLHLE